MFGLVVSSLVCFGLDIGLLTAIAFLVCYIGLDIGLLVIVCFGLCYFGPIIGFIVGCIRLILLKDIIGSYIL